METNIRKPLKKSLKEKKGVKKQKTTTHDPNQNINYLGFSFGEDYEAPIISKKSFTQRENECENSEDEISNKEGYKMKRTYFPKDKRRVKISNDKWRKKKKSKNKKF